MIFNFTRKHTLPQYVLPTGSTDSPRPPRRCSARHCCAARAASRANVEKRDLPASERARTPPHGAPRTALAAPSATRFSASLMFVCTHDRETRPLTNCAAAAAAAAAASRATRTDARRSRQPRAESTPVCAFLCRSPAALRIRTRAAAEPRDNHKVFVLITPQRRLKASKPQKSNWKVN